jgi:hypothetical protein
MWLPLCHAFAGVMAVIWGFCQGSMGGRVQNWVLGAEITNLDPWDFRKHLLVVRFGKPG